MRIVRFIEKRSGVSEEGLTPRWGLLDGEVVYPVEQAPYLVTLKEVDDGVRLYGAPRSLPELKLVAPVIPGKVVCVGRNYAEHAAELGNEVPSEPLIFLKPPSTVIGPDAPVVYPSISQRVDHEGELAVVIGRRCRYLAETDADKVIFGYTIANDVTARDLQKKDGQWTRGKGFDSFAPIGPWIDTDFDPANRAVRCLVNGEVRQDGNTALLIYSIGRVLAYVTQFMTLEPGDLLLTGTPAGVGPVQPGDVMTVEVEGLGSLSNPVISEAEARRDAVEAGS
jgi:2-keto-4-pentenoate hydratase/2-oxohepta-3-ene-1,7-dioic acid hydratase in catechol pathway